MHFFGLLIAADPTKIDAMTCCPTPTKIKQPRGFLGLTGYYKKFVTGFGTIAFPLTQLLKKDSFKWNIQAQKAFKRLKRAMTEVPMSTLPDFNLPFVLETDASGIGVKAVLMQQWRPIALFSHVFPKAHQLKLVYEQKLIAIVLVIQKWRSYLLGRKFTVRTDQKSLEFLLEQRVIIGEYQKWVAKVMGYDFAIEYKKGLGNSIVDALSHLPIAMELNALILVKRMNKVVFVTQVNQDSELSGICQAI